MTQVLDKGYLNLVPKGCWGSDELIIEAARMSTNKGFQGWGGACPCQDLRFTRELPCERCQGTDRIVGDEKLLRYLWTHGHTTPFEMAGATFEVYAPIFVVREWMRHRTQSYNEMSGRYTELPDDYYMPSKERLMAAKQSSANRQGSDTGFDEVEALNTYWDLAHCYIEARKRYEMMLERGVSREIARLCLPVSQYSRFRASANLWNWLRFLQLRLDKGAQWEIQQYAVAAENLLRDAFPRTLALFNEGRANRG